VPCCCGCARPRRRSLFDRLLGGYERHERSLIWAFRHRPLVMVVLFAKLRTI
jgi:hypothetical protein